MIDIKNLSKSYNKGAVKAVDNLNMKVNKGEIFGFLGPNGAGKTTTIKLMVGLLNQDEGTISINGYDNREYPLEAKRSIGFVPDNPDVYERLTGIEYLNFLADVYQVSPKDRRERIDYFLNIFELADAASDLIKSYSHGMKQKIVLTGALIHNPDINIASIK
jgi:ABC-2 type transport system ATP-binding protein